MSYWRDPLQYGLAFTCLRFLFVLLALTVSAEAGTRLAKSARFEDVNAAVASAQRTDTVKVPAGSADWGTNTLTLTKGIKLIGAGRDGTRIISTATGVSTPVIWIEPDATTATSGEEIRIEGFTFDGAPQYVLTYDNADPRIKLAVGWNRFLFSANTVISIHGQARGVIYQNEFDRPHRILGAFGFGTISEYRDYPFAFGTSDQLYFESNYIHFSSVTAGGGTGWSEIGQGGRAVLRYNTFDYTNAVESETLDIHGFQGFNSPRGSNSYGQTGSMGVEMYGNLITGTSTFRNIMHRGGEGMFFDNIISGSVNSFLQISQYGDPAIDNGGSGCQADVEATCGANRDCNGIHFGDTGRKSQVNNTYCWNNTVNGTLTNFVNNGALPDHCGIAENTDFWNYNASFGNGTSGIGRGTSVPTTTGNPDGVAYWVTSSETPTTDPAILQNGHLWKRVGGAWVDYYHPFTYPHPLAGPQPTSSSAPAPPTALHVVPPA